MRRMMEIGKRTSSILSTTKRTNGNIISNLSIPTQSGTVISPTDSLSTNSSGSKSLPHHLLLQLVTPTKAKVMTTTMAIAVATLERGEDMAEAIVCEVRVVAAVVAKGQWIGIAVPLLLLPLEVLLVTPGEGREGR
jgi:hypothetical protein